VNLTELRFRAAGLLGAGILRLLGATIRYEVEGAESYLECRREGVPVIFAFWHAWILPMAYLQRDQDIMVLVSEHGDGEYITRVIHRMGFTTARGSSTRGGVQGARRLIKALRQGMDAGITPDGPRGPAGVFKPGALVAAQLSGARIVPIAVHTDGAWRLDSWDRFAIPKPFATVRVRYGPPQPVPRKAGEEELKALARTLEVFIEGSFDPGPSPGGVSRGSATN